MSPPASQRMRVVLRVINPCTYFVEATPNPHLMQPIQPTPCIASGYPSSASCCCTQLSSNLRVHHSVPTRWQVHWVLAGGAPIILQVAVLLSRYSHTSYLTCRVPTSRPIQPIPTYIHQYTYIYVGTGSIVPSASLYIVHEPLTRNLPIHRPTHTSSMV